MAGLMYGLTDRLTLMAMGNYTINEMSHVTDSNAFFRTRGSGFGDTTVTGLYNIYEGKTHYLHLNAGVSLPTGSINERDDTPAAPNGTRLPFKMQPGSGTFDLKPGLTYSGHSDLWGWGAQYSGDIHLGRNYKGYALGDRHTLNLWGSYRWANWISTSLRLSGETEERVSGDNLNPMMPNMVPTADPDNYGGEKVFVGFGINLVGQRGALKGHRIAIEATLPLYQDLNGPQLESDHMVTLGYQYTF